MQQLTKSFLQEAFPKKETIGKRKPTLRMNKNGSFIFSMAATIQIGLEGPGRMVMVAIEQDSIYLFKTIKDGYPVGKQTSGSKMTRFSSLLLQKYLIGHLMKLVTGIDALPSVTFAIRETQREPIGGFLVWELNLVSGEAEDHG